MLGVGSEPIDASKCTGTAADDTDDAATDEDDTAADDTDTAATDEDDTDADATDDTDEDDTDDTAGTTSTAAPALADPNSASVSIAVTTPATLDHRTGRNHSCAPTRRTIRARSGSPNVIQGRIRLFP